MKTYRLIIKPDGIGGYCVSVTDNTRIGQTVIEIQAENYIEAQKKISFEKTIKGKLFSL